jgi:hypothetical protein
MDDAPGKNNQPETKSRVGDGTPGPGRPKGSENKTTKLAKSAIAEAAERLGGTDRLVAWCKEDTANERVFWGTIYPKLLPLQLANSDDGPLQVIVRRFND